MITASCSACGKSYKLKDDAAGKQVKCAACGQTFGVPAPVVDDSEIPLLLEPEDGPVSTPAAPQAPPPINPATPTASASTPPPPPPPVSGAASIPNAPGMPAGMPGGDDGFQIEETTQRSNTLAIILLILAIVIIPAFAIYTMKSLAKYKAQVAYIDGVNALTENNNDTALEKFKESIGHYGEWVQPYFLAGFLSWEKKETDEAVQYFESVIDMDLDETLASAAHLNLIAILSKKDPLPLEEIKKHLAAANEADKTFQPIKMTESMLKFIENDRENLSKDLSELEKKANNWNKDALGKVQKAQYEMAFANKDKASFLKFHTIVSGNNPPDNFDYDAGFKALKLLTTGELGKAVDKALVRIAVKGIALEEDKDKKLAAEKTLVPIRFKLGQLEECVTLLDELMKEEQSLSQLSLIHARCYHLLSETMKTVEKPKEGETKKSEKTIMQEKALSLYDKIYKDKSFLKTAGVGYITAGMEISKNLGENEKNEEILSLGLDVFSDNFALHKFHGMRLFKKNKYKEGIAAFEKSISLNKDQPELVSKLVEYKKPPIFSDYRPSKPADFVKEPLVHIRVKTGSPFPIDKESIKITLDGETVKHVQGGNELFYLAEQGLEEGKHEVKVVASDLAGNTMEGGFSFPVDGKPPIAKMVSPNKPTEERKPLIEVKLLDELSDVFWPSVTILLKNHESNKNAMTAQPVFEGKYTMMDKSLNRESRAPISKDGVIKFNMMRDLKPGKYVVSCHMQDVVGNKGVAKVEFEITGTEEEVEAEKPAEE